MLFKVRQVESGPNLGRSEAACGQTVNVQKNYYSRAIKTEEKKWDDTIQVIFTRFIQKFTT